MKKLKREIFIEAAENIFEGRKHYCCFALKNLCMAPNGYEEKISSKTYLKFFKQFEPTDEEFLEEYKDFPSQYPKEIATSPWWIHGKKEERILALLLCAEMIEEQPSLWQRIKSYRPVFNMKFPYKYKQQLTKDSPIIKGWIWAKGPLEALDRLGKGCYYAQIFFPIPWPCPMLW